MTQLFALLASYNTAVVLIAATCLGVCGGLSGVFALLRKRSLISDAIGHAALPGVALGFLVGVWLGLPDRNLFLLLSGGLLSGLLATLMVHWVRSHTRLGEDTAIATALALFFGLGAVLLSVIQSLAVAGQAGLNSFLLGTTATISAAEASIIGGLALVVSLVVALLFKEFRLLAFDPAFASALGYPVRALDLFLMGVLLLVVSLGLKSVGLILIVAIVIIPPAAARFWTGNTARLCLVSAFFGGLSGAVGAGLSAALDNVPTGAAIVLSAGTLLLFSLICAPRRGLLARLALAGRLQRTPVEHLDG